ncbi:MAG: hypothetical protein PGN22_05105 [Agrobacterium cavarae]
MSIDLSQIQSIADGALMIQALRNRYAEGHDVVRQAEEVMDVINSLECQTADDALALIDIAQVVAADLFINAGGDMDDPYAGNSTSSNAAAVIYNLQKAMTTIRALMVAHSLPTGGPVN